MIFFGDYEAGQRPHCNIDGRGPRLHGDNVRARSTSECELTHPLTSAAAVSKLRSGRGTGGVAAPLRARSVARREANVLTAVMALLRLQTTPLKHCGWRHICIEFAHRRASGSDCARVARAQIAVTS